METMETNMKPTTKQQWVYSFGQEGEQPPLDRNLLGGKGKNLAEMASIGIPVPPGCVVTTEACNAYRAADNNFPAGLEDNIDSAMAQLEKTMGRKFGDNDNPLLVSVRSGARVSMPGMMDTVLNLGLNNESVKGFAKSINDEKTAYQCYTRLISMYGDVVTHIPRKHFDKAMEVIRMEEGVEQDMDVSVEA